jgi:dTDP-4-dehydrorhamnose reductase
MPTVLITGGSGYLGKFLVDAFSRCEGWTVVYTYNELSAGTRLKFKTEPAAAFKVDFARGEGIDACFSYFEDTNQHLDAVINCVAISQPNLCENNLIGAILVNIPIKLLDALNVYQTKQEKLARNSTPPLLIHLSTDQVYDGSKSFYKESDDAMPINKYGNTKLGGEQKIQSEWPAHTILRSSLIYGKEPPAGSVGRSLFLQFIDSRLASGEPTSFFKDEWRSAVYVEDIIRVCKVLIEACVADPSTIDPSEIGDNEATLKNERKTTIIGVFNMGGPERLSRVDMAKIVADVRGHDLDLIEEVPSASVDRGVPSPADISMDSSKLESTLTSVLSLTSVAAASSSNSGSEGFKFTKFRDALHEIFGGTK